MGPPPGPPPLFVWGFPGYLAVCWAVSTPHLLRTHSIHTSTNICEAPTMRRLCWIWQKMGRCRACPWRLPPLRRPCTIPTMSSLSSSHHPPSKHISLASLEPLPLPAFSFLLIQPPLQDSGSSQCAAIVPVTGVSPDFWCRLCEPGFRCQPQHPHIKATLGPGREGDCPQGHV